MNLQSQVKPETSWSWAEAEHKVLDKTPVSMLPVDKNTRVNTAYKAVLANLKGIFSKKVLRDSTCISFGNGTTNSIQWNISTGLAQVYSLRFSYMNQTGKALHLGMKFLSSDGTVLKDDEITFPNTPEKWRMISTTTGTFINAGHYRVILSAPDMNGICFESLTVQ